MEEVKEVQNSLKWKLLVKVFGHAICVLNFFLLTLYRPIKQYKNQCHSTGEMWCKT